MGGKVYSMNSWSASILKTLGIKRILLQSLRKDLAIMGMFFSSTSCQFTVFLPLLKLWCNLSTKSRLSWSKYCRFFLTALKEKTSRIAIVVSGSDFGNQPLTTAKIKVWRLRKNLWKDHFDEIEHQLLTPLVISKCLILQHIWKHCFKGCIFVGI